MRVGIESIIQGKSLSTHLVNAAKGDSLPNLSRVQDHQECRHISPSDTPGSPNTATTAISDGAAILCGLAGQSSPTIPATTAAKETNNDCTGNVEQDTSHKSQVVDTEDEGSDREGMPVHLAATTTKEKTFMFLGSTGYILMTMLW